MNTNPHTHKDGAALVIAIGFLAILTIIVVAFSVQTRTERLAGRGFLVAAQTRQLLHTALARAMEDIDTEIGQQANTNYPDFLALGSLAESTAPLISASLGFQTEEAYIPGPGSPIHTAYLDVLANEAQWQTLDSTNGILGRIGYIVLNTSGLLDANSVGGYALHNSGISPREIQLSGELLSELSTNAPPSRFAALREFVWRRFETLRDVAVLNSSLIVSPVILTGQPESFSTFSLFPNTGTNTIPLTNGLDRTVFVKDLLASGLDTRQADVVYEGYLDYVDADSIPRNLQSACVEAVPMINEIWIENLQFHQDAIDATNIDYSISGDLFVETWYPFDSAYTNSAAAFIHAYDPEAGSSPNNVEIVADEANSGITITAVYGNNMEKTFILELANDSIQSTETGFNTLHYTFEYDDRVVLEEPFDTRNVPPPEIVVVQLDGIDIVAEGHPVDRAGNIEFQWPFDEDNKGYAEDASCIDPRINFDVSDAAQWEIGAPSSSNAVNNIANWGEESDLADKTAIRFHVRNGPMENAAELGYLSTGEPWRTVRLYGGIDTAKLNPVLDHFDAGEAFRKAPFRPGLINLNSRNTNVLATAFFNAPIQYSKRVSSDQARCIGGNLAALAALAPQRGLAFIGNAVSNNIPDWTTLTDAQKESIVANTYRLFGWRDNLFTILLVAQKLSGDEIQSTQKAVAYVWRDPETGNTACVFYGLADTLQSSISGPSWNTILGEFKP